MRHPLVSGVLMILIAVLLGAVLAFGLYQLESSARANQQSQRPSSASGTAARAGVPAASAPASAPVAGASASSATSGEGSGDVAAGSKVFTAKCNACHPGGAAGMGPAVRGAQFATKFPDDGSLKKLIRDGAGAMPGFPSATLSDADLASLTAYMRSLK